MRPRSTPLIALLLLLTIPMFALAQTTPVSIDKFARGLQEETAVGRTETIIRAIDEGLPIRHTLPDGRLMELQGFAHNQPLYYITSNANAALTVGADKLWPGGLLNLSLTGKGMTLGVWDEAGVRATHRELVGRVSQKDVPMGLSEHSTHVAGTMVASGVDTSAKGMSYEGRVDAYDWNSDTAEMAMAASQGLRLSNHSYGFACGWTGGGWAGDPTISMIEDYKFGFYLTYSRAFDQVLYAAPDYLSLWSAGNDRGDAGFGLPGEPPPDGGTTGFDTIHGGAATAKNTLTVGAVNPIPGGYTTASSVVMSAFSGWGPCDDGRIKPDLVADGVGLYSCSANGDSEYTVMSGTSMATPNTTGALGLLLQHYMAKRMATPRASMMKALAIHTAREAGSAPGPDYSFGWGLLDVAGAADTVTKAGNGLAVVRTQSIGSGGSYSLDVIALGGAPLKATIVWTDPAGTPPVASLDPVARMLVNDLDLRIAQGAATVGLPWRLDGLNPANPATKGDNIVDNVEQVVIDAPVAGATYRINVTHKGVLTNGSQEFSLVVTGTSPVMRTLTVQSDPMAGIQVIGDLSGTTPYTAQAPEGGSVSLRAPDTDSGTGKFFRRWKNALGVTLSNRSNCTFIIAGDMTIIAEYGDIEPGYHALSVTSNPDTGLSIVGDHPGVTPYSATVHESVSITLRAPLTTPGHVFSCWTDGNGRFLANTTSYTFHVSDATSLVAKYVAQTCADYTLTVKSIPTGAVMTGTHCGTAEYSATCTQGEVATITAPPTTGSSYFYRWKSASNTTLSYSRSLSFSLISDMEVTAEYADSPVGTAVKAWGLNNCGQIGDNTLEKRNAPVWANTLRNVTQVVGGRYHSLALCDDGTVWAWGTDAVGQNGSGISPAWGTQVPVQVEDISDAVFIAAGDSNSLAVTSDGRLFVWGCNTSGQAGNGTQSATCDPTEVPNLTDVVWAAAGSDHIVALKRDGTVYAWGHNGNGQLGDGTVRDSSIPVQVDVVSNIIRVAAGAQHTLALRADGVVFAWGANSYGQLGNGRSADALRPVEALSLTGVTQIVAGAYHSLALKSDGTVWVWGGNWWGQLGVGNVVDTNRPVRNYSLSSIGEIAAGAYHSAALSRSQVVYGWGWNRHGQIGNATFADSLSPASLGVIDGAKRISAGGWHTLVVADPPPMEIGQGALAGTLYSAGDNAIGQLALGDDVDRNTFTKVSDEAYVMVETGFFHTIALKADGTVWTSGANWAGQLGLLDYEARAAFVQVPGMSNAVFVAAGAESSMAITSDGKLWLCGASGFGEWASNTFTEVSTLSGVVSVAGGVGFIFAQTSDGKLWVAGENYGGQLGLGDTLSRDFFVESSLTNVAGFACGWSHALVYTTGGSLYATGANYFGQLGLGTSGDDVLAFSNVPGVSGVSKVTAGASCSLVQTQNGRVYGSGTNDAGRLGMGALSGCESFAEIPSLRGALALDTGAAHTLALMPDYTVWASGYNAYGQLGMGDNADRNVFSRVPGVFNVQLISAGAEHSFLLSRPAAKWTFMVYLDGDNDLEPYGIEDFLEMARVGSSSEVNIVVQMDRVTGYDSRYDNWTDTRRGLVRFGDTPSATWGESVGEVNMADPDSLVDFVQWTRDRFPADHYALVLWNHGDGWRVMQESLVNPTPAKGICSDETSGDVLEIREAETALAAITASGDRLSLIGMDACLMSMLEVAYAIRNDADVMVGSEELEPGYGWPYNTVLGQLCAVPTITPSAFGGVIVDAYYASYGNDETQAAIDLSQIDALVAGVDVLAQYLRSYYVSNPTSIKTQAQVVRNLVDQAVIHERHGASWPGAHGLAIYLPLLQPDVDYNETHVGLAEATQWDEFLTEFYATIQYTWVGTAASSSQYFYYGGFYIQENVDLYDFCSKLGSTYAPPPPTTTTTTVPGATTTTTTGAATTTTLPPSAIWVCGSNSVGELGLGDTSAFHQAFTQVPSFTDVIAVAGGTWHSVLVRANGALYGTGSSSLGQLGGISSGLTFRVIPGMGNVRAVAAGERTTLALASDGTVWGCGASGSYVGAGSASQVSAFTMADGLADVVAIAAGDYHSLALCDDGTVWSTGFNSSGQLGQGDTTTRHTFTQVAGVSNVIAIAAGHRHSVLLKSNGTVWVAGSNADGQIGLGTAVTGSFSFVQVTDLSTQNVMAISAKGNHTFVRVDDSSVFATGVNIGIDDSDVFMQVLAVMDVAAVSAGGDHVLLLKNDGTVWAGGSNLQGQLGQGDSAAHSGYVQVPDVTGAAAVIGGAFHSILVGPTFTGPSAFSISTTTTLPDRLGVPPVWEQPGSTEAVIAEMAPIVPQAAGENASSIDGIVDNRDASAEKSFRVIRGRWLTSDSLDTRFRNDYAYAPVTSGSETARAVFQCTTLPAGRYDVYAWWPSAPDRAGKAAYEVVHAAGRSTVRVNQTQRGGRWNLLGTYQFQAGKHQIEVHNGASGPGRFLGADAVRFVPAD